MRTFVIRLAVVAVIVGVLGGAIAAVVIPSTAAQQAPAVPREPVSVAPAVKVPRTSGMVQLRRTGPITVAARTPDPDGGPEWAVRSFLADRMAERGGRMHVISRARCVQLGRIHRGIFGWIDDRGTFRPATISLLGAPIDCGSRKADVGRAPYFSAFRRLITPADGSAPRLGRTVAWGYAGSAARKVDVTTDDGRSIGGAIGRSNAVLHVVDEDSPSSRMRMTVEYESGKPVVRGGSWNGQLAAPGQHGLDRHPDFAKQPILAARAADPNGGLPYGVLAQPARGGGWCVSQAPGRIVEDRVGRVDFDLGTFSETQVGTIDCQSIGNLTRERPVGGGWGGGDGIDEPGADPGHGRVARRTLPGTTFFAGAVLPDVRTITLKSPRDVRTVVPSSPAHVYLVVYDGTFTTGEMRITSTFDDDTSKTTSLQVGF